MRSHVNQRHERVLEIVRRRGSLRVTELAEELAVSAVTVRRDVETLAEQGRLTRLHGSVSWPRPATGPTPAGAGAEPAAAARTGRVPAGAAPAGTVLGMVVPSMEHYFAELVRGAQDAITARGGRLVLGIAHWRSEEDTAQIGRMLDAGVDGLLLQPSWERGVPSAQQEEQLLALGVPAVLVDRRAPVGGRLAGLDSARSDHVLGGAAAVHHLAGLGHRRMSLLAQDNPTSPQVREGYQAAVAARGLAALTPVDVDPEDPRSLDAAARLLYRAVLDDGVTAAIVHNDQTAIGVAQRLREHGLAIPDDVSLVAYEDEMAALADVPLTAVAPPRQAVGETAVELMLARLGGHGGGDGGEAAPSRHVSLVPRLTVRASSAPPAR
ncbi:substrate-binding domain-containing protein [Streptomyces griseoviridis]|uniref:DNA-binding LacI/PurR family transcriptional regulator n=3 Tax=Streptomyces TaxID=1883 RepID=A0ABT9L734_STRGD|nr:MULTISPECIES: substrate-binding domain-containing protein [Streptomyces]MDP9679517.1 DNA-binding LacI/PurR family transcriptional regulator [Streptomyces griseoviridis]GGS40591.1 DeoR family transcriptional regulator [Streptomyces niveoruber]GGT00581.1 DeoR family transcriptional regulator [Streptomyces griseoviridis]GGU24728.1 DeoR family transcriptional regulator [Streptomyces daghestanicus]GHI29781.1 DeoR family transcriptional regulator [Streptomyces daghestanicus]